VTLIHHPGSYHQMARTGMDTGTARDIALMLTDAHAVISGLAGGDAPAAAAAGPDVSSRATPSGTTGKPRPEWRSRVTTVS
jgi:hypothetical protein